MTARNRLIAGASAGLALAAAFVFWQTRQALSEAGRQIVSERSFAYNAGPLSRTPPSQVEHFTAPATFTSAAVYRGKLYLSGPAGLFTAGGEWRAGQQLPPAALVGLSVGVSSESHEPELWIATAGEGLLAFDGSNFRHIRPAEPKHRKLTSVLALPSGRVLLGTEAAGVLVYDGRSLAPLHDELNSGHVTALAGSDDAVWAGLLGKGLRELRGGEVRTIDGLPDPHVLSIAVQANTVYAGTALGTAAVRNARVERVYAEDLFAQALMADDEKLTVGTLEQGVVSVPLRSGRGRSWDVPGSVSTLLSAGGKLMSIGSHGVFDVASGERLYAAAGAVLSDRNVSALAEDREGRLWVGYFDRGLDIIDSAGRARHIENEHLFCINRIVHARDYTAVATANGLVLLDREGRRRQVLGRNEGLLANHVTDVAVRDDGLVAATPAGLTFIGKSAPRSLYAFHGLVNNHVYSVATAEGALVAGTLGGASLLRGDIVQANYTTANSRLPQNWITSVARVAGEWWLGTYGEGVLKLDGQGRIGSFPDMPRAVVNPNAMLASNGRVYAGTLSDGLLVYFEGRWRNASAGLPSVNVTAVASCGSNVCVGTDNGLVRLR